MSATRSNQQWLKDLRSPGVAQNRALEDLRSYLLGSLASGMKRYGAVSQDFLHDVVQDSLFRVLDRVDMFEGRSRFTTWATAIAVRSALTELRRRHWKDVSLDDLDLDTPALAETAGAADSSPERNAAQREILLRLASALERLTERQRTAILAELRGMPQEEIGHRLGLNRNAVYKLGHDARKKLKRELESAGFDAAEIREAFA